MGASPRFGFKGFPEALAFLNRVAEFAARENHFPDLSIQEEMLRSPSTTP